MDTTVELGTNSAKPVGIALVPTALVPNLWGKVEGLIEKSCRRQRDHFAARDLLPEILQGKQQLWVASDKDGNVLMACLTEVAEYARRRILIITNLGGSNFADHKKYLAEIEEWGKDRGCTASQVVGRKGWERELKDVGYEFFHVVIEKDLKG